MSIDTAGEKKAPEKVVWRRKNPYYSTIATNRLLSGEGSAKEIRHYEFDLGDSGIEYNPGDGLAVIPSNSPELVSGLLARLALAPDAPVTDRRGNTEDLLTVLTENMEICAPSNAFLKAVIEQTGDAGLAALLEKNDRPEIEKYLWGRDYLQILTEHPTVKFTVEEFVKTLRPLMHRTYSISSSLKKHPGQVHATIATVRFNIGDRKTGGVCSTFLTDRKKVGETVGIFLVPNKNFQMPEDDSVNMIMVGPGTGVAPFLAFLQEREARGASGQNWLFFGDQHKATDFIYQEQLEAAQKSGILSRLDLAFSRDQEEKYYVQNRMKENGKELYNWIEQGASFYICGDASRMAPDVETALCEIIQEHGGKSEEEALAYIEELQLSKRYLKDVY